MDGAHPTTNETLLEGLRKNWMLILFIGSIIIQWSNTSYRLTALESVQTKTEQTVQKNTEDITKVTSDFNVAIIEIKSNYLFIKEKLDKLDAKN